MVENESIFAEGQQQEMLERIRSALKEKDKTIEVGTPRTVSGLSAYESGLRAAATCSWAEVHSSADSHWWQLALSVDTLA